MRDLDVAEQVLEDEQKLDPSESRVEQLEAQEQDNELAEEEHEAERDQASERELSLDEEVERETRGEVEVERESEARRHYRQIIGRVGAVLHGERLDQELDKEAPGLSQDEMLALELFQEAVTGRDRLSQRIVYAERRSRMLEVALATLQPTLSLAFSLELSDLRASYDEVVEQVGELRVQLDGLDAAEEELIGEQEQEAAPGEKPKPEDEPTKPEDGESTLEGKPGEPAVEKPAAPSTLYGKPDEPAVEKPAARSTTYEPDR
jgi:hypothetical protein